MAPRQAPRPFIPLQPVHHTGIPTLGQTPALPALALQSVLEFLKDSHPLFPRAARFPPRNSPILYPLLFKSSRLALIFQSN
jgi:hypothetical protein